MKQLLLMRHGEAVDVAPGGDGDRWLTGHGRTTTRAVAQHLVTHTPSPMVKPVVPGTVWTSPLVRAVQTAEIVAHAAGLEDTVRVLRDLATGDVPAVIRHASAFHGDGPLCLVGHEPTLSQVVARLLGTTVWPGFKKSAVCSLAWDGHGPARFAWMLLPKHLRVVTDLAALT